MKTLFAFIAIIGLSFASLAQDYSVVEYRPRHEILAFQLTDIMASELNLSENQIDKVRSINLKYARLFNSKLSGMNKSKKNFKAVKADLTPARDMELKSVLSAPQFSAYKALESEIKLVYHAEFKS